MTAISKRCASVTAMFASDKNVAAFGDLRYNSISLGKVASSLFWLGYGVGGWRPIAIRWRANADADADAVAVRA
jgi:hypothetical protein